MLNLQTILRGFEENGLKQESMYKADEILAKLDIMGRKEFDRDIAEQLFQQCKPTQLNLKMVYRLADIGQTIIDAMSIQGEKAKNAELQLRQIQQNKAICENQLAETSVYSDTRYLFLTLLCVKNIPLNLKYTNCHIQLTLGVINQIAKPESQYDKVNPEFNQDFEFSVPPLISTLQIQFFIRTENTLPILWGSAQLKIQQLDDQVIKQVELKLVDPVGRELGSSVEMEAQIVLNKHQYLQAQLQKFEQRIFTLDNDLIEYRNNLEIIERPFKAKQLSKEQTNKQLSSNIFNQQLHTSQNQQEQDQNIYEMDQQQNQLNSPQEQKEQIWSILQSDKQLEIQDETPEAPEILQHGVIIFTIYGLITLFVCSAKPSFLDVLVCHGLMFTILMDRFDPFHIKLVGAGLLASILYDILWMKQYHLWWYSDDQNNPEWGLNAVNLLRFVLIFTYMQFLYKFVVCYYLYQFHRESIDPTKRYVFTIWKIQYKVGKSRESVSWQ
ncbi:unnamed protein product (macronuclear) [Paramecium tetraurelia]|uniref:C2 domain-containing protein n=1 Tax=Paramecium tetraurelia TaxID=5888 RepID=A0CWZ9_PARTE|nr:uncharacterized protein GSPATT00001519001 [Paramecium tetraurelia]CAK75316.1 unnamed protein product [Paramecium tetraurelia]|eukprot:XP_001442713.1 hypothetical protein (macronuclear) [Paramecium tetraurelia strain d4-2]